MPDDIEILIKASVDDAVAGIKKLDGKIDDLADSTKKGAKETKQAGMAFTEFSSILSLAERGAKLVGQAYDATVGSTLKLAESQRELSQAGQITVEEAGKLIQIGDDLGVSADTLKTAFREMAKDGMQPTLANIKEIAKGYKAIEDPTERLQFAQDKLGRSYQAMLPFLEKTPDELDAMAKSAEKAGLVMSGEAVAAAREYELALDELSDRVEGLKVKIGTGLIPELSKSLGSFTANIDKLENYKAALAAGAITQEEFNVAVGSPQHVANIDKYREALAATGQKVEEYNAQQDRLVMTTGATVTAILSMSDAHQELAPVTEETKNQTDLLSFAMSELTTKTLFLKASQDLDAEASLSLARMMGLVDENAIAAARKLNFLKEQYDINRDGSISAAEAARGYTAAVRDLSSAIESGRFNVVTENFGKIGGRQHGGQVNAGQPVVVGERGPEVFRSSSPGTVIPNSGIGRPSGPIIGTVNVGSRMDAYELVAILRSELRV